jgi:predicted GIY-YIG superfamily endonuclease
VWLVYILQCADGSFYVGETHDIELRLSEHSKGCAAAHTAKRRPVQLVYVESHENRATCLKRERQIKGWTRLKKQALVDGDKAALKRA